MDNFLQDLRYAARSLAKQPAFALVSIAALAIGIGANTAIFSVVNGVLFHPLPYENSDRLVRMFRLAGGERGSASFSMPDLRDIQAEVPSIAASVGFTDTSFTVTQFGDAELIPAARVTNEILPVFGLVPHLGRDLRAEEAIAGAPPVVMISYSLWRQRFAADPDIVGKTLEIGGVAYEIVGVAAEGFQYPLDTELWVPHRVDLEDCGRGCHMFRVVASMAPGIVIDTANAELAVLAGRLESEYPDSNTNKGFTTVTLIDSMVGNSRRALYVMLGAVGMVLLIACANVANLLLIRASGRAGEVAVRYAVGAGRARIVRQLLVEAGVLATLGAALGLLFAHWGVRLLLAMAPNDFPRAAEVRVDATVLLFAVATAAVVSLVFGLAPALRLARVPLTDSLRRGAVSAIGASGGSWSRTLFLTAEVALSVMLLLGAGLLQRSFAQVSAVDLGYETENISMFSLSLPSASYETPEAATMFFETLQRELAAVPGVVSVGAVFGTPLGANRVSGAVTLRDRPEPAPGQEPGAHWHAASPGYFETMGIPLLRGRGVEITDRPEGQEVVIISETFARTYYPDEDPIGKPIDMGVSYGYEEEEPRIVVGVVGDVRGQEVTAAAEPEIYVPAAQAGPDFMSIVLRTAPGAEVMGAVRSVVHEIDPMLPLRSVQTMDAVVAENYGEQRFYSTLLSSFATVALLLAAVGLYGVVGYMVVQRTHEIAIRKALGATPSGVVAMVLRQGAGPVACGIVVGLATAYYFSHVMAALLYETSPGDPLVFGAATAALLVVALVALLVPASRASRIEAMGVLRQS